MPRFNRYSKSSQARWCELCRVRKSHSMIHELMEVFVIQPFVTAVRICVEIASSLHVLANKSRRTISRLVFLTVVSRTLVLPLPCRCSNPSTATFPDCAASTA